MATAGPAWAGRPCCHLQITPADEAPRPRPRSAQPQNPTAQRAQLETSPVSTTEPPESLGHWANGTPHSAAGAFTGTNKKKKMAVSFIEAYFLCQGTRWDSIYPRQSRIFGVWLNFGVADGPAGQPRHGVSFKFEHWLMTFHSPCDARS